MGRAGTKELFGKGLVLDCVDGAALYIVDVARRPVTAVLCAVVDIPRRKAW